MDQGALVVSALVAGARAGTADAASPAVKDTYDRLKLLILPVVITVAEYEKDPDAWQAPLTKALLDGGVADNPRVIEAAQELLALLKPTVTHDVSPKRWGSGHRDSDDVTVGGGDGAPASWDEGDQP